jgi:hypothetical protein
VQLETVSWSVLRSLPATARHGSVDTRKYPSRPKANTSVEAEKIAPLAPQGPVQAGYTPQAVGFDGPARLARTRAPPHENAHG